MVQRQDLDTNPRSKYISPSLTSTCPLQRRRLRGRPADNADLRGTDVRGVMGSYGFTWDLRYEDAPRMGGRQHRRCIARFYAEQKGLIDRNVGEDGQWP